VGFYIEPEYAEETREFAGEKPHTPVFHIVISGYRFYNPESGRWLSRDPIQEADQINLYNGCHNNPVGCWDFLGLETYGNDVYTPDTSFTAWIVARKSVTPLDRQLMMHWLFGAGRDYNVFNSDVIHRAGVPMVPFGPDKSTWMLSDVDEGKALIAKVCANQRGPVYPDTVKFRTSRTYTLHHAMIGDLFLRWEGSVYACNNKWYYIGDTTYNDDRFDANPLWAGHRDIDGNVATAMIGLMNLTTSATPFSIKFRGTVDNTHDGNCP
jgi:RHS repeat-associated protein